MTNREDEITAWFAAQSKLNAEDYPIGIGDDMAEIRLANGVTVLITTDMLLDGVHFDTKKATLRQIGYKSMAASLSDCAAMATIPVAAVAAVALPKWLGVEELKELHSGINFAAEKYSCPLVGGDITSWRGADHFAINITILSKRAGNEPVRRSGAKVGDVICVTGTLGGSLAGKHMEFEPRVEEALKLMKLVKVNSMMDISDGLSSDLNRICHQSKVGALIYAEKVPISKTAMASDDPLKAALNDGEDFELLFTLSKNEYEILRKSWKEKLAITEIGIVTGSGRMQMRMKDGEVRDIEPKGFDHLK